jgi:hypothetical protein
VLRSASQVTAVSPGILSDLQEKYPWLEERRLSAMPYGAEAGDLEAAKRLGIGPPDFHPGNGSLNVCFTVNGMVEKFGGTAGNYHTVLLLVSREWMALREDVVQVISMLQGKGE